VEQRQDILDVFHDDRFADLAVAQVYTILLDEGHYLGSERTMYRVLAANLEVRERRAQLMHPRYAAPELLATKPNQLWSWDITKLKASTAWSYFYLYVIIDVFSRCVVGWMVAPDESATLAEKLIAETYELHGIEPGQLTIHADRGSSMRSKLVAQLLADLGVTKTHSRPHVSNDNPFSESACPVAAREYRDYSLAGRSSCSITLRSCARSTGFTMCAAKPAAAVFARSSGWP